MVLHLGVAAMALSAVIIYAFTLGGADYNEFISNADKYEISEPISRGGVSVVTDDDSDTAPTENTLTEQTPLINKTTSSGSEEIDA